MFRIPKLVTLLAVISIHLAVGVALAEEPGYRAGHILVKPAAGLPAAAFDRLLRGANPAARAKRQIRNTPVHLVEVPERAEQAIARMLARHPLIAFAELDRRLPPDADVNDPDYGRQWHLPLMGAVPAWQYANGEGIVVAVLDTGVYPYHTDLSGQVLSGWNVVSNNTDSADIHNHGTWVAGVIAAKANNLVGGASVAPGAKILPIRITNSSDGRAYLSDMAEGITWAADHGARVANISYSGAAGSATVANAAAYMMDKGGVVVISAGNDNIDYGYGNYPSLYVAGATTSSDAKAGYSSFGNFVDIAAPGSSIYTTSRNGGYSSVSGTSFASPNTAAVAALVMAANPDLLPTDVLAVISSTAVDLGDSGWDPAFGHGRVDALAAAELAANARTSDTTPPQVAVLAPAADALVTDTIGVTVAASDDFGVARVDLLLDGQVIASDLQSVAGNQYAFAWDSTAVADGAHRIGAQAVDAAGNLGSAQEVDVQVANNSDAEPPVVTITSPVDGGSGSRSVALAAQASDNVAVTQISIYADGQLRCAATSSVSCTWNLRKVPAGTYSIDAVAEDAAGNQGSASIRFTVQTTAKGGGKGKKSR